MSEDLRIGSALILIGAPGSGKSSVLEALSTLLEIEDVRFGAIETEQLARGWPWLSPAQWIPQLREVIDLQRKAGRERFLVAATPETAEELGAMVAALRIARVMVVCLSVPGELAAARVADREPDSWPGKLALVEHARELAREIPLMSGIDLVLSTADRHANDVATELREHLAANEIL